MATKFRDVDAGVTTKMTKTIPVCARRMPNLTIIAGE
jgi:hypothetical protein